MQKQQTPAGTPTKRPSPYVHPMPVAGPGAVEITFRVHREHGPALRAALDEIRSELGERVAGAHKFDREAALTAAITALGPLFAAVNRQFPTNDPSY